MPKGYYCPFYRGESGLRLHCEMCDLRFPDKETRREIAYGYCGGNWHRCPFAQAMQRYYGRKNRNSSP